MLISILKKLVNESRVEVLFEEVLRNATSLTADSFRYREDRDDYWFNVYDPKHPEEVLEIEFDDGNQDAKKIFFTVTSHRLQDGSTLTDDQATRLLRRLDSASKSELEEFLKGKLRGF